MSGESYQVNCFHASLTNLVVLIDSEILKIERHSDLHSGVKDA